METFYIGKYTVEVHAENTKAGDPVDVDIRLTNEAEWIRTFRVCRLMDDTLKDLAQRAFCHYKLGNTPESKRRVEKTPRSSTEIRASISVNEKTFEQVVATLRSILDEPEPRRPYHLERMIAALNLCTDVAKSRSRLEAELQKALQSGK